MTTREVNASPGLLVQADHAERSGDRATAAAKLRAYLSLRADARPPAARSGPAPGEREARTERATELQSQQPEEGAVRLRLARLLLSLDEPGAARTVLQPLDGSHGSSEWARQANRLLAALDEVEGALSSAQIRWERVLADDIDDNEAHSHLRALSPRPESQGWPAPFSGGTLVSPDGVRLSRFKMVRELGRGSSAAVYLVRDERLELELALKVLHPQLAAASRADARQRFFAEARLAARLRHPGVVAIYGVDEAARCLAMEYVAGGTIRDRLRAAHGLANVASVAEPHGESAAPGIHPDQVVAIARSLLAALAYVHGAGIVHGDLKPGNVLLRSPREVVLADFGVAALASDIDGAEGPGRGGERGERGAGTPLYLAPEQFRGAPASPATDLFATGAILWELLQGRPARRQVDLLAGDYSAPLAPAAEEVATPLDRLIGALMSDPTTRPPSARAALSMLDG